MPRTCWVVSALGLLASACGMERLEAGSANDGTPPVRMDAGSDASSQEAAPPLWPYGPPSNSFNLPCTKLAPPELAGTWLGRMHSYQFPSGSSAVRVEITGGFEQADGLCGTVTFGAGSPPPLATDPAADPPGLPATTGAPSALSVPIEGFSYEFYQPGTQHVVTARATDGGRSIFADAGLSSTTKAIDGDLVRFSISLHQPLKSWCNIQSSYILGDEASVIKNQFLDPPKMNCIPLSAIADGPGSITCPGFSGLSFRGVSCAQATYCAMDACVCESGNFEGKPAPHGCTVMVSDDGQFNLKLNGSALTGTVSFGLGSPLRPLDLTREQSP